MQRRQFLGATGLLAGATLPGARLWAAGSQTAPPDLREAFAFALPIFIAARTRHHALARNGNLNRLNHRRRLSTPADRNVTTPNVDTLYSAGWLDLSEGPVIVDVPQATGRYASLALMDMLTDHVAIVRPDPGGRRVLTISSDPSLRTDGNLVSSSNDLWAILRVEADSDSLDDALDLQARFQIAPAGGSQLVDSTIAIPGKATDAGNFLAVVGEFLTRNRFAAHSETMRSAARNGLLPLTQDGGLTVTPSQLETWSRWLPVLLEELSGGLQMVGESRNGWAQPLEGIGNFGNDYVNRARVAVGGLGALPVEEATYLTATADADGALLDGSRRYVIDLPDEIPAEAFWSLTAYQVEADGRQFLYPNNIDRYAVQSSNGDAASIRRIIMGNRPVDEKGESLWLPVPEGRFSLTFRIYRPSEGFERFTLPAVQRVENAMPEN